MFPILGILLGISSSTEAFQSFSHPLIFLFFGSFLAARAVERYGCAEWLAQRIVRGRWVMATPYRYTLTIGAMGFALSMWLSNTATAAAMLPLIPAWTAGEDERSQWLLKKLLLLLIAYSVSLGGVVTPIGTPPNLIALGFLDRMAPDVALPSFLGWSIQTLPFALILFIVIHFYLYIKYGRNLPWVSRGSVPCPGRLGLAERRILFLFSCLVLGWFLPSFIQLTLPHSTLAIWLENHWPEVLPAVIIGVLWFVIPGDSGRPLLQGSDLAAIDWNTLLLFGGGLTFGSMAMSTGLVQSLIHAWTVPMKAHPWLLLALLLGITIIGTELISNTAMANIQVPIAIALAKETGLPVWPVVLGTTIACSMAFMLPVSTPPNAIVFGSGTLTLKDMFRAGCWADFMAFLGLFILTTLMIRVAM